MASLSPATQPGSRTTRRPREIPASDGFGPLLPTPATRLRRPASRFFCLEAPLSWISRATRLRPDPRPATPAATLVP